MGALNVKIRRGRVYRLVYSGSHEEAYKVGALLCKSVSAHNVVTLQPEPVFYEAITRTLPTTLISKEAQDWYEAITEKESEVLRALWTEPKEPVTVGQISLLPHQITGRNFLRAAKRAILGDFRGGGKTVTALASIEDTDNNVLILVKPYLFSQWEDMIQRMELPHRVIRVVGSPNSKMTLLAERLNTEEKIIVLASYATTEKVRYMPLLLSKRWDLLICDEAHCLTNRKNVWTKAVFGLAMASDKLILATAQDFCTKYPDTIWPLLNMVNPDRFPSYWDFYHYFIESYEDWFGPVPVRPIHTQELAMILSAIRIRREWPDVSSQIPPKIETPVFVKLQPEHREGYLKILRKKTEIAQSLPQGIATFGYLQRYINAPVSLGYENFKPKTDLIIDMALDILQEGGKILIFGIHKEYLRILLKELQALKIPNRTGNQKLVRAMLLEGDIPPIVRDQMVKTFKADPSYGILLATIGSSGTGINLPEVNTVFCVDIHWNPETMGNAVDRAYRLTSTGPVNVYYFIARGTIDEVIYEEVIKKKEHITEINSVCSIMQKLGGKIK